MGGEKGSTGDMIIADMVLVGAVSAQEVLCITCVATTLLLCTGSVGQSAAIADPVPGEGEKKEDEHTVHGPSFKVPITRNWGVVTC